MVTASHFIDTFMNYLGNAERLPFETVQPYLVREPIIGRKKARQRISAGGAVNFKAIVKGEPFASISVAPLKLARRGYYSVRPDKESFLITLLDTESYQPEPGQKIKGYGRELLRRAVLYADDHGYKKVKTTIFIDGSASFWHGMGFNSDHEGHLLIFQDVPIKWDAASPREAAVWQDKLKTSPTALWDLARTEIGRLMLSDDTSKGILDLQNSVQRNYAFGRLHLDRK